MKSDVVTKSKTKLSKINYPPFRYTTKPDSNQQTEKTGLDHACHAIVAVATAAGAEEKNIRTIEWWQIRIAAGHQHNVLISRVKQHLRRSFTADCTDLTDG